MDLRFIQPVTVRSSAVLTNSYVAGTVLGESRGTPTAQPVENNQLIVYVNFTIGSLTSAQVKIEFSPDNSTWYQESSSSISSGTSTESLLVHSYSATGNYRIATPICDKWIRISAQGTGTVTNSLMAIQAIIGTR